MPSNLIIRGDTVYVESHFGESTEGVALRDCAHPWEETISIQDEHGRTSVKGWDCAVIIINEVELEQ
jgi:hypothetical protein